MSFFNIQNKKAPIVGAFIVISKDFLDGDDEEFIDDEPEENNDLDDDSDDD